MSFFLISGALAGKVMLLSTPKLLDRLLAHFCGPSLASYMHRLDKMPQVRMLPLEGSIEYQFVCIPTTLWGSYRALCDYPRVQAQKTNDLRLPVKTRMSFFQGGRSGS